MVRKVFNYSPTQEPKPDQLVLYKVKDPVGTYRSTEPIGVEDPKINEAFPTGVAILALNALKPVQFENVFVAREEIVAGRTIFAIPVQSVNAYPLIVVTPSETMTLSMPVQPRNRYNSTIVNVDGIVSVPVKPEQPLNAYRPMVIIPSGIISSPVKPEQSRNACSAIAVLPLSSVRVPLKPEQP